LTKNHNPTAYPREIDEESQSSRKPQPRLQITNPRIFNAYNHDDTTSKRPPSWPPPRPALAMTPRRWNRSLSASAANGEFRTSVRLDDMLTLSVPTCCTQRKTPNPIASTSPAEPASTLKKRPPPVYSEIFSTTPLVRLLA
jgi:hypothetical protein